MSDVQQKQALALRRFGDAANAYQLSLQACREALGELLAAQRECGELGIMVTVAGMPGAAAPPRKPPTSPAPAAPPSAEDEEIRQAIRNSNPGAFTKPPKTGG